LTPQPTNCPTTQTKPTNPPAGLPHNDIAAQICRQAGLVQHEVRRAEWREGVGVECETTSLGFRVGGAHSRSPSRTHPAPPSCLLTYVHGFIGHRKCSLKPKPGTPQPQPLNPNLSTPTPTSQPQPQRRTSNPGQPPEGRGGGGGGLAVRHRVCRHGRQHGDVALLQTGACAWMRGWMGGWMGGWVRVCVLQLFWGLGGDVGMWVSGGVIWGGYRAPHVESAAVD